MNHCVRSQEIWAAFAHEHQARERKIKGTYQMGRTGVFDH
jgi:hypothetical protein